MKLSLLTAGLVVATVSCSGGGPSEQPAQATAQLESPPLPAECEALSGTPVPVMRNRAYARREGLVCGSVTSIAGRWVGSQTLLKVPGFCTFDWTGPGVANFSLLRRALRDATIDRAACGGEFKDDPSLFMVPTSPEGGISCGACTYVGVTRESMAMFVLPLSAVQSVPVRLGLVGGGYPMTIDLPANAQVVFAPIVTSGGGPVSGSSLFVHSDSL